MNDIKKQSHHISPVVYESRTEHINLGGVTGIAAHGLRLLSRLGIHDDILAKGVEIPKFVLHSLKGKTMGEASMMSWTKKQTGFGNVRIRSVDVMDVLLDAVRNADIPVLYGKRLVGIEEKDAVITASFSDGTQDSADFLLGCDGIHSAVRKLYVDPECIPEYSGIANMFSLIPAIDLLPSVPLLENMNVTLTSDGLFGLSPVTPSRDRLYWSFYREIRLPATGDVREGWEEQNEKEIANLKSNLLHLFGHDNSDWMTFLRDVLDKTEAISFYPIYKMPPGRPWSKGRCLIIGDAAHALQPHGMQGISMALEDVFLFSKLLASGSDRLEVGLQAYEEKRKARTEKVARTSEQNGAMRPKATPLQLLLIELAVSVGLWIYKMAGLDKFGFGQEPIVYDIDDEQF
ncbi:hypothetical protein G7Z17_g3036 [Cylindrodendrum hubeiense]|uniref:FAD-binding domain-containing protein n=1 Tax=Cylindrodendrum hubeiense TaxID=595255 RepID=A0A9P5HM11_9HYPO|nr:hypothetical protein G7Z17_g3036 [Cylindrodendrum hubeiense]